MPQQRMQFAWPPLTLGIKILLITYAVIFLIFPAMAGTLGIEKFVLEVLALSNEGVFGHLYLWQPLTYQFLHGDIFHLLFNGMVLYFFGGEVEQRWKTSWFVLFMVGCGFGAGVLGLPWRFLFPIQEGASGFSTVPVVGASGAISAVVAAFCLYQWNRKLRLLFAVEIQAKWILPIFIGLDVVFAMMGSDVSVVHHVTGMIMGLLVVILIDDPQGFLKRFRIWRLKRKLKTLDGGRRGRSPDKKSDTDGQKKNGHDGYLH